MREEIYFEISCSEDGYCIQKILPKDLEEYLADSISDKYVTSKNFLDDFPVDRWNGKKDCMDRDNYPNPEEREVVLIKGTIVTPKKVEVTTKLKLED